MLLLFYFVSERYTGQTSLISLFQNVTESVRVVMDPTITSVPPVLTQLRLCSWENVSIIALITSSSEEETVLVRFYHC